jgi:hypothetical protein
VMPPGAAAAPTSPWVRQRAGGPEHDSTTTIDMGSRHESGLLQRGVHAEHDQD